jgi:RNA polymerase sigma-70 factor (ECF subfamily)
VPIVEQIVDRWEETVNDHGPLVWRIAIRLLGNEHDAADCYQNVFLQAFEFSQRRLIENWPGFLTRLTTTRAVDLLRVRSRHRGNEAELHGRKAPAQSTDSPSCVAEAGELTERLQAALTKLPPEQADVFCLRYFEQLSNPEIASRLATNTNHVGVLLHRARAALRECLGLSESPKK